MENKFQEINVSFLNEDNFILPSDFDKHNGSKFIEFKMICKFIKEEMQIIKKNYNFLFEKEGENFKLGYEKCNEFLQKVEKITEEIYKQYAPHFYSLLSIYNIHSRLKKNYTELRDIQEKYDTNVLPQSSPCEYVDQSSWRSIDEEKNKSLFIGHGYYWHAGDNKSKDIQGMGIYPFFFFFLN